MRGFMSGVGSRSSVAHIDIRLDQKYIVLRGSESVAADTEIKGKLVICNTEQLRINRIILKLAGTRHNTVHMVTAATAGITNLVKQEEQILHHVWTFEPKPDAEGRTNPHILPPGNHEWDFSRTIEGSLPESVEGHYSNWIAYRMKATVDRSVYGRDIVSRQHLRILRAPHPDTLEIGEGAYLSNTWPEKVAYEISTPKKVVTLGSTIPIEGVLIPQLKGLKLGKVQLTLVEHQVFTAETSNGFVRRKEHDRLVREKTYAPPEDAPMEDIDGFEGYRIRYEVELPANLRVCLQSVETKNILVKHWIKCHVGLQNPDGHTSELRVHLPITVYIPPSADITSDLDIERPSVLAPESAAVDGMDPSAAPPMYGEHQLDALYGDVDPRTFQTPGPSTHPSRAHSRRASTEIIGTSDHSIPSSDTVSAQTLRSRLTELEPDVPLSASPPALGTLREGEYFAGGSAGSLGNAGASPPRSRGLERTTHTGSGSVSPTAQPPAAEPQTDGEGAQPAGPASDREPEHIEWEMDALSRVPSYQTAVHSGLHGSVATQAAGTAAAARQLPDYAAATGVSTPPSSADQHSPGEASADRTRSRFGIVGRGGRRQGSSDA